MTDIVGESDNLDDLLRAANPVNETDLPLPAESASAQRLYEAITGTPYAGPARAQPARGRRRRWIWPGVVAAFVLAGGAAAIANAGTNHLTTRLAVTCYSGPSLQSHALAVSAQADGPVATCSSAWASGDIGSGPVPLLVACLTPQGVAAVFPSAPGADVCSQVGMPALPAGASTLNPVTTASPTTATAGEMPDAVRDAIVADLTANCFTASEADVSITDLLQKAHVTWSVILPTAFPPGHPCASPGFDEVDHEVVLTGVPAVAPTTS